MTMFAASLHALLALGTAAAVAVVSVVALVRRDAARATAKPLAVAILLGVATSAVGAAMLVLGERPREWLHYLYAGLTLTMLPYATVATTRWPRTRRAWTVAGVGLVTLVLVVRLYATG